MTVRKNITIPDEEYMIIQDYCKKVGITFSELLRKSALKFINESEQQSMLQFFKENCDYVDEDEQKEIEKILETADMDISQAEEMDIHELL